ncbi:MAG: histone deacetylase [Deltaproteobacteria bacterium]|nr:histone deacetylase [Deltaproteobacteria bacterium]
MNRTGLLFDDRYLLHRTGPDHPEAPERLTAIRQGLQQGALLPRLTPIEARPADQKRIEVVHAVEHIRRFEEACLMGKSELGHPDNQICEETFATALLAAGGVLEAAGLVLEGKLDNAFCAVRPPGHHAEADQALGFCFFNNVAVAARFIQQEWGIERIGIIDFDVHHGNGTQHIFERESRVFYYSIHEHPTFSYPGTGREFERGLEAGYGYTLNSPVLPGYGDLEYRDALQRDLLPAFDRFKPEVILVSAGFDAHQDDDMSAINLTTAGYSWIMNRIMELAERHARGRIISVLEGGYALDRLPELAANHVKILLGNHEEENNLCGR